MFATLGEISFELLGSPFAYESSYRWTFAEHKVVEARPRLQWISEALQTISLDLRFHASFTEPGAQLESLLAVANAHSAQAFVLGNGEHQGYFVIVALRVVSTVMTAIGDIISMTVNAKLKEWALESELDPTAAPLPNFTPIAVVTAPERETTSTATSSGALGVAATITAPGGTYIATPIGAPGVSSILVNVATGRTSPATVSADDVPASAIVRSAA